jgi:acetylornithine deacetylase/succinyl-diaminopimelate desuccinylase-like protein
MKLLLSWAAAAALAAGQTIDWKAAEAEALRHFTALVQLDTQNPPGNETRAVEYLRKVLDAEGIASRTFALEPSRANLVARLKGSGAKKPLLVMAHTDTVRVDPARWTHPPFSAHREGGYIYGRGTVDDKDNVAAALMTLLLLHRNRAALDRDVIFLFEAGEEASTRIGIDYMVANHWAEIEAEICLAEGGGVTRRGGKPHFASVQTAEKIPNGFKLISRGPAGHGSVPLESNAIAHLSAAVQRVAAWLPPMRMNDTTRTYFERLSNISTPGEAARYKALLDPARTMQAQRELATAEPRHSSMLRTSVSPNIIRGGYQINVIPSEAEATLDVRALPDEDMDAFLRMLKEVVNDPAIEILRENRNARPKAPPSDVKSATFKTLEVAHQRLYGVPTLPTMSTGATDMAMLRARGVQAYGIGPMLDVEDGPKGFGAHSDQERILEEALYKFVRLNYEVVLEIAGRNAP